MLPKTSRSALILTLAALVATAIFVVMMWTWIEDWAARNVSTHAFIHSDYPTECGRLCIPDFWESADIADIEAELANGADINGSKNSDLNSPLHLAIEYNYRNYADSDRDDAAIIELMLKHGADPNASGFSIENVGHGYSERSHRTPLQLAVQYYNRPAVIKLLLEYGANPNPPHHYDYYDEPLLVDAVGYGRNHSSIALLLEYGADVNVAGARGFTPLHQASIDATSETVQLLLDYGADVHARSLPDTAIHGGEWATPLHVASTNNPNPESIEILLKHGADVNAAAQYGYTPLHLASAHNENLEVLVPLLEHGADVLAKDIYGNTALHRIANPYREVIILPYLGPDPEYVQLLLDSGADVNAKNLQGLTPLHLALQLNSPSPHPQVIALLLDWGADVNAKTIRGETPLHTLAEHFITSEFAPLLLDRGADVNAKTVDGNTPLHIASRNQDPESISLLLDRGAEINAENIRGETPLHLVAHNYFYSQPEETITVLLDRGANTNATDNRGRTPCQIAEDKDSPSEIRRLVCQ